MGDSEKILAEVTLTRQKVESIDDILRGKDGKVGLIAIVQDHDDYIKDKKNKGFDLYRLVMGGMVTLLVALVIWIASSVKNVLQNETLITATTNGTN